MESKNEIKKVDKIKNFVKSNYGTIIASGVFLTAGCLLGYKRGVRIGKNNILDEIVVLSCKDGLIMKNPALGRYVFTAKKLENVKD